MRAKNGQTYKTNYDRAVSFFETTLAATAPGNKGEEEVKKLFLAVYRTFSEKCEEFSPKPIADVSFKTWEKQAGRENDVKAIRGAIEKINEFFLQLLQFVKNAKPCTAGLVLPADELKLKKTFFQILNLSGINISKKDSIVLEISKECAEALQKLTAIAAKSAVEADGSISVNKEFIYFSRAVFHPETDWLVENYDYLMNADGELLKLCKELEKNGFQRVFFIDGNYLSLNYVIDFGKKPEPLKKSFGERNHLGIEISFENINFEPGNVWMRLPQFTKVLEKLDTLPKQAADFISDSTKTCDACGYCVQMDKTGKKPLAAVKVGNLKKCPRYPAFSMRFTEFDKKRADNVKVMLLALKDFISQIGSLNK